APVGQAALPHRRADPARAGRPAVVRGRRRLCVPGVRQRARPGPAEAGHRMDSRRVGCARVRLDRDERQPRSAAVLPAGGPGSRARRRNGGRDRDSTASGRRALGRRPTACHRDVARRRRSVSETRGQRLARYAVRDWPDGSAHAPSAVRLARRGQVLGARQPRDRRLPRGACAEGRDRLCLRLLVGRVRLRRQAERVSFLLEPSGDRPLQRRESRLRRQRAANRPRSARACLRGPPGARLARRAELGAVFPRAAGTRELAARPLSPRRAIRRGLRSLGARGPMTDRRFWLCLIAILLLAAALRGLFPAADPPWRSTVGVVWHDEGAWTHNARNKALYGAWVQDQWNPVYIAPVFTGLEYASFEAFGVGLRQARLVSETAGVISIVLIALGLRRMAGNAAGLFAGALLATNYVYVMYDRAAIMEALMTAFIVASWYCVARAERQPWWGALAGVCAALAFFTKAAAAAYVAALALAAVLPPEAGIPPDTDIPPK